ncbi:hypothetical protein ACTID9_26275 [Brevibacillus fluminis]|uniref:hypothetical protein n=1 Tax=Brevibacillus fluminis TaxID=511487 RepID=UPI003F88FD6D
MKYTIESISQQIRDKVEGKFQILLNRLAVDLAYDFIFRPKYIVTHEFDSPWDYSGTLLRLDEGFSLDDYPCIGDFLEEYTGNSIASYISGCGFFHDTYEEKYEQLISEFIFDCYNEVLSHIDVQVLVDLLLKNGCEISEDDKTDIIQTIIDFELFEEVHWYHLDLLERIKPMSFKLLIFRGKDEAIKQYNDNLLSMKKR